MEKRRGLSTRWLSLVLGIAMILSVVMIPRMEASAAQAAKLVPMQKYVVSSLSDRTKMYFDYIPTSADTKVTITAFSGSQSALVDEYTNISEKEQELYVYIDFYRTGTYRIDLVEYKKVNSSWQTTGIKCSVAVTVGAKRTGWYHYINDYYYYDSNGKRLYGWQKISGKWYYFDERVGMMHKAGWDYVGNHYYYFESSGAAATGWKKINNKWYHFTSGGVMDTGWKKIDNVWYYFGGSGAMVTGWQPYQGNWYYLNSNGAMAVGWKKISNKWYYFQSGIMVTGWKKIDGYWYYFDVVNGFMLTGWQKIDNNWYYLRSGVMVTGEQNISGTIYYFDKYGVWQQ